MHSHNHAHRNSKARNLHLNAWLFSTLANVIVLAAYSRSLAQEAGDTLDQTPAMTVGFESDLSNGYYWHGLEWSYGKVFQNSAWMSAGPVTLSLWSNYEPSAGAPTPDLNEIDCALSLVTSVENMSLEPAVNFCFFPEQPDVPTTVEVSLHMVLPLGALEPFIVHTVDVKAYPGAYFGEVGLSGSWSVSDRLTFETGAEIGWGPRRFNEAYLEIAESSVQLVGGTWPSAGPRLGRSMSVLMWGSRRLPTKSFEKILIGLRLSKAASRLALSFETLFQEPWS